jgi:hypothetical protein
MYLFHSSLQVVADYGNTDQMRLTELMLKNVSIKCIPKF